MWRPAGGGGVAACLPAFGLRLCSLCCSPLSSLRFTWESFSTLHVTPHLPCNLTLWPFLLLCIHPFMKGLTQQRVTEHPENPEARLSESLNLDPNQLCLT